MAIKFDYQWILVLLIIKLQEQLSRSTLEIRYSEEIAKLLGRCSKNRDPLENFRLDLAFF